MPCNSDLDSTFQHLLEVLNIVKLAKPSGDQTWQRKLPPFVDDFPMKASSTIGPWYPHYITTMGQV